MPYRPSPPYSPYLEPQWPSHTQAPSVFYLPSKAILSPVDYNVSVMKRVRRERASIET